MCFQGSTITNASPSNDDLSTTSEVNRPSTAIPRIMPTTLPSPSTSSNMPIPTTNDDSKSDKRVDQGGSDTVTILLYVLLVIAVVFTVMTLVQFVRHMSRPRPAPAPLLPLSGQNSERFHIRMNKKPTCWQWLFGHCCWCWDRICYYCTVHRGSHSIPERT